MRVSAKSGGQLRSSPQGAEILGPPRDRHDAHIAKHHGSPHKLARRLVPFFNNVIVVSALESLASQYFIAGELQALAGTQNIRLALFSSSLGAIFSTTLRRD